MIAVLLSGIGWSAHFHYANADIRRVEQVAIKDVGAYADAYEQYLTRSIGQIDQITMQLKHSWEQAPLRFELAALKRAGMFTDPAFVHLSIMNERGEITTAIGHSPARLLSSESIPFAFHRNDISTALRIWPVQVSRSHDAVVRFTRRLDGPNDEFRGLVSLLVDARFFTSYYGARTLGRYGSVAVISGDGVQLEQHGEGVAPRAGKPIFSRPGFIASSEGAAIINGRAFDDGRHRIVGWHHSPAYHVTALASIAQDEALAVLLATQEQHRKWGIVITALIAIVTVAAMQFSRRAIGRRMVEQEVQRAYRTATESANDGFYMVAAIAGGNGAYVDFEIVDCNERGAYFYGRTKRELIGMRLTRIQDRHFAEELLTAYQTAMRNGFYEDERCMPINNRHQVAWSKRRIVRVGNGLAITMQDISGQKKHEHDLLHLASRDSLTGLPNRHWLNQHLPDALTLALERGSTLALLFIDLDDFKHVNDTQGHAAGDVLLQLVATRVKSLLRPSDSIVRFGGDEFIVLLDPANTDEHVGAVAQRVLDALTRRFEVAGECHIIGASIGISMFPRDGMDAETLIKNGDIAMYAGKGEGKGQYRFFDPALCITRKSHAQLKHELSVAIEEGQLELHYQPRVKTQTGLLCSMEALVRWRHPQRGLIAPGEFIPLAESSGLIVGIGNRVIDMACAQLAQWRASGIALMPVSINVSPRQFDQAGIHQRLRQQLMQHDLDPALLEVEITESTMMADRPDVLEELNEIRALGIKLHVDDFGTGYSSLSQLQKLKMDVLKVDRAFTSQLDASADGRVFFQAIISMANALGMSVVAEGVETSAQLDILRELGCEEIQGYFVCRPIAPEAMATMMQQPRLLQPCRTAMLKVAT